ncbi:MAG: HNH endonuclease [Pseudomonadota bacterium]
MPISANLESLTNSELHQQTIELVKKEQQTTLELLNHLHEVERRKLFAEKGYGSLWDYVQGALGYSENQAYERISAMRLMFRSDEAKTALERGKLTLTQAAMAERHLRAKERSYAKPVPAEKVESLVNRIEGLSKRETEKVLLKESPEKSLTSETVRSITAEISEVRFPITEETRQAMERFWGLKGRGSVSELFSVCLDFYLSQKDPSRKDKKRTLTLPVRLKAQPGSSTDSTPPTRYIAAEAKRMVRDRSRGRCEYVDPQSGRRCESRYLLEFDHIDPYWSGGSSNEENIRHLCRMHNQYLAGKMFQSEAELLSSQP